MIIFLELLFCWKYGSYKGEEWASLSVSEKLCFIGCSCSNQKACALVKHMQVLWQWGCKELS